MTQARMIGLLRCIILIAALTFNQIIWFQPDSGFAEVPLSPISSTWIMKWNSEPDPAFLRETDIVDQHETFRALVVRPRPGIDPSAWHERWSTAEGVAYLQVNQKVQLLAAPNDELYKFQNHLRQIGAPTAWDTAKSNLSITIAIIDTGVDLDHPDLKASLVEGINLIDPKKPPMDDHGHGTNVAGVVAAAGDNQIGVSGVVWNTKIMPIKALEDGEGDEDKLGEGIRYAVDHGAKIIIMSLGLHRYSPFLQEVTEYAEEQGVLLVSATGNEGKQIKYPAAFPTVLAVGGVDVHNKVMLESNYGPEIDLVAPWEVFTTALGGRYAYNQGTSMAAPQVAGVAALAMAKYPLMKPYEIRNLLRQTAQDIGPVGWDSYSGYGMVRADLALSEMYRVDLYKPNDKRETAKRLPIDSVIYGELVSGTDSSWFYLDPPYKGTLSLQMEDATGTQKVLPVVNLIYHPSNEAPPVKYEDILRNPPKLSLQLGKSRIQLQYADSNLSGSFRYKINTPYTIYRDDFEDNDKQYKSYTLTGNDGSLTGTFHQVNDQDWFSIQVEKTGSLFIDLIPDSMRMDVAIMVQKNGEKPFFVDRLSEGETESVVAFDVTPGRYYILISNVISDESYAVLGEYRLNWRITPKLIDPNEPNDKSYQAAKMVLDTEYRGLMDNATDADWFTFAIPSDSYVRVRLNDIPDDKLMLMTLYDSNQTQLSLNINSQKQTQLELGQVLKKGTYYIKLGANKPFSYQLYRLIVQANELVAGLRDIKGHWAEQLIGQLAKDGDITGYPDFTFRPDVDTTRAEAVAMLVKAFGFTAENNTSQSFSDIPAKHWASGVIRIAVKAGMINGYDDGTFRPDQPISRAEMAVMIARGAGLKEAAKDKMPFSDVTSSHWAAGWIKATYDKKLISGYPDGTYHSENHTSRAELASVVSRIKAR